MPRRLSGVCLPVNEEIVLTLHSAKIREFREYPLSDPDSLLSRMLFAMTRVPRAITDISNENLKTHLMNLGMTPPTRFEVVRAINEVLKYLGRAGIENPRPARPSEVSYVPLPEFLAKAEDLPKDYKIYLGALYACGARFGELPCVQIHDNWVFIASQLRKTEVAPTKNKGKRHAAILPHLKPFIMAYKAFSPEKQAILRLEHYHRIYGASRRVLGANIHTLRHSYAIECVRAGKSIEEVAKWIGDSEEVAKKHYIGYLRPNNDPWG